MSTQEKHPKKRHSKIALLLWFCVGLPVAIILPPFLVNGRRFPIVVWAVPIFVVYKIIRIAMQDQACAGSQMNPEAHILRSLAFACRTPVRLSAMIVSVATGLLWILLETKWHQGNYLDFRGAEIIGLLPVMFTVSLWLLVVCEKVVNKEERYIAPLWRQWDFVVIILTFFLNIGLFLFVLSRIDAHNRATIKNARVILAALRPKLIPSEPGHSNVKLTRPYVILAELPSGFGISDYLSCDLTVRNFHTLIVINNEVIDTKHYTNLRSGVDTFLQQYRYRLWAFDIKTGELGAYQHFDDAGLVVGYLVDNGPPRVDSARFLDWANEVTK